MHDLVLRRGRIADGTGQDTFTGDVAVQDGRIVEVGRVEGRGRREIDADGRLVTPGFVDIHTHYDAQATWDPHLLPSGWHGVTTAVVGNCGVGFAPAKPEQREMIEKAYLGELTHQEIRTQTGLPLGTIKSRIFMTRRRLKDKLRVLYGHQLLEEMAA